MEGIETATRAKERKLNSVTGIGATDAYVAQMQATAKAAQNAQTETKLTEANQARRQEGNRRVNENAGNQPLAAGGTLGTKVNVLV